MKYYMSLFIVLVIVLAVYEKPAPVAPKPAPEPVEPVKEKEPVGAKSQPPAASF